MAKIVKANWTQKEKRVFDWLVEWVNDDENVIATIVNGHSYEYGTGVEEVDRTLYGSDPDYRDYIDSQRENWLEDVGLPGSGWWLVGSQY